MPAMDFKNIRVNDDDINTAIDGIITSYQQNDQPLPQNEAQINVNISYEVSYEYLLDYAKSIVDSNFTDQGLIVLAHAVYGWMPTILTIQHGINPTVDLTRIKEILREIYHNPEYNFLNDANGLKDIANFTNKSFVGASKFLHFLFPNSFAIWDSNINSILQIRKTANNVNAFVIYQRAMKSALSALREIQMRICLRDIEKKLFDIGRQDRNHNDN